VRLFSLRVVEFRGREAGGEFVFGEFGLREAAGEVAGALDRGRVGI